MLDMGFIRPIRQVIALLPRERQNLLFSATYSEDIRALARSLLRSPLNIDVAPRNATADRVDQQVYRVPKEHKRHLLAHLILSGSWDQVLVFTRTKHGANRLTQQLEGSGIRAAAIHGNKSQGARVRALEDFKGRRITALVATEVAARGLDIKELPHVVNYELPNVPEDYVHRIGRTARAGGSGCAVSLVSPDEALLLKDIERLLKRALTVTPTPDFPVRNSEVAPARPQQPSQAQGPRSDSRPPQRQQGQPRRDRQGGHGGARQGGHGGTRQDSRGVVQRHGASGLDGQGRPGGGHSHGGGHAAGSQGPGGRHRRRNTSRTGKTARAY
jgi:ATP-dependent RNA helicase RhlE